MDSQRREREREFEIKKELPWGSERHPKTEDDDEDIEK